MENVDNAMETEIDAVTDEYGEQTPSLSQEKALLKEPMEGIETNNPQRVSNSTGDGTDANNPPWNKETPIPNANIDPNEQQATPKGEWYRSIDKNEFWYNWHRTFRSICVYSGSGQFDEETSAQKAKWGPSDEEATFSQGIESITTTTTTTEWEWEDGDGVTR